MLRLPGDVSLDVLHDASLQDCTGSSKSGRYGGLDHLLLSTIPQFLLENYLLKSLASLTCPKLFCNKSTYFESQPLCYLVHILKPIVETKRSFHCILLLKWLSLAIAPLKTL